MILTAFVHVNTDLQNLEINVTNLSEIDICNYFSFQQK